MALTMHQKKKQVFVFHEDNFNYMSMHHLSHEKMQPQDYVP